MHLIYYQSYKPNGGMITMDEYNKRNRDFSGFFEEQEERKQENKQEHTDDFPESEKTSYHYSYGPFKSSLSNEYTEANPTSSVSQTGESSSVEVSRPRSSRYSYEQQEEKKPMGNWAYPTKKKSSFKSVFSSFLAGAVIMGSLMFASDSMNLFTFNGAESETPASVSSENSYFNTANNDGSGGEATNAAMSIVRPDTIADIVEKSSPAVVKIETMVSGTAGRNSFNNDFFRDFFGDNFQEQPNQPNQELRPGGVGSGFIFEKNGYILTNQHVLSGAEQIYVTVEGHKDRFKAELLGSDYDLDLAVLKIEGNNPFKTLPLGNSADLRVGDWVTAIGNPVGFDHTVSVGVISANEREINIPDQEGARRYKHLLQTDASINPGNSGGPLLNLNGEVIGINTAVSAQAQGIGFAIPTSTIVEVLDLLKNNEDIPKPYIGVYLTDIDETWQQNLGLDNTNGSLITQIESGSPASKAGLQPGDVIVKVDNTVIENTNKLIKRISEIEIGKRVTLEIIRDSKVIEAAIVIGDRNQ